MRRLFQSLFFALVITWPAVASAAQDWPLGSGPSRSADVPSDSMLNDSERGRIGVRRFGECVLYTRRKDVISYFTMKMDSTLSQKALDRLITDRCLRSGDLKFSHWYYRGILFRAAYYREFTLFPEVLSPEPVDFDAFVLDKTSEKAKYYLATMAFAQCVVRADPKMALRFINAYPGSASERKAIAALKPNLAGCVPAGAKISFSTSMVEALLSEAIYRESKAAASARSAPEAKK